jgi:uncharacterized protein (TIGR02246 family)
MKMEHPQVVSLYERLLAAWNQRNPEQFAAVFADDGTAIGFDGSQMNGRAEIEATLRGIFGDHQTATYVAKIRDVRELAPGVALLRAVVGMVPPGAGEINPRTNAIQSVVVVCRGNEVKIALLQNTPAAFHGRPELAEQLTKELTEALATRRTVVAG